MPLQKNQIGPNLIVYLDGNIDLSQSVLIETELLKLIEQHSSKNLILDFTQVSVMSSSGVRVLVLLRRTLKETKQRLALCNLGAPVLRIIKLLELDGRFEIFNSQEDALRAHE